MSDLKNSSKSLTNDELWLRAAKGGSTSLEELGIERDYCSSDGITCLHEGAERLSFELNSDRKSKK